jgi:ATP-binding cassette subfamily B protein
VVEEGSHEQLIRIDGGVYRRLFERQALELTKGLLDDGPTRGSERFASDPSLIAGK